MPILIQNITGNISDNISDDVNVIKFVQADFGYKDWFKIGYLEVFLQNYKQVSEITDLNKTKDFGLIVNNGKTFTEINISY